MFAAHRRWLVVGVAAAVVTTAAMAVVLLGSPLLRQAFRGQVRTPASLPSAAGSDSSAPSRPQATKLETMPGPVAPPSDEDVLRTSLDAWLAATNQRDLSRVLAFYSERVSRFYLARDVSRDMVAVDKARQFRQATVLDVRRTSDVALTIDPAGDAAVMRFTKGYVIAGPGLKRQGESLHELRWAKRESRWTIVGERDLRVLR